MIYCQFLPDSGVLVLLWWIHGNGRTSDFKKEKRLKYLIIQSYIYSEIQLKPGV